MFYLKCDSETLTTNLMQPSKYSMQWSVSGLSNGIDYYMQSNRLYIKPYALVKI
jgi:hypothetical protein